MNRRTFLKSGLSSAGVLALSGCNSAWSQSDATTKIAKRSRPNVLFIAVDDLRCDLGCYGDKLAITPNIDKLASRGVVFSNAYCQMSMCNPSRSSLLTGKRPDTIRVWNNKKYFRDICPDVITLPQFFKNNGYESHSIGKILHSNGKPSKDPLSWSIDPLYSCRYGGPKEYIKYVDRRNTNPDASQNGASSECVDVNDDAYIDGCICDSAIQALERYKKTQQSFFLAVGFQKPHLPFCAPKKYWDMYDRSKLAKPATYKLPDGAPQIAGTNSTELRGYMDIPKTGPLSDDKIAELRHGYYAATSYTDAQVGKVLDELDKLGMRQNTIIVLWGDHGWHVGEHGLWGKKTNYELCTRSPLLFSIPGQKNSGRSTNALVEFVDVYPSLVDLCGFAVPKGLEGVSFKPLFNESGLEWKQAAFSQFYRPCEGLPKIMGYSIRTKRYRYTEWRDISRKQVEATELYDYVNDPDETKNIADQPTSNSIVTQHKSMLRNYKFVTTKTS